MASRGQVAPSGQLTMSGLIDAWIEEDARKVEAQPERVEHFTTVTYSKLKERGWTDAAIQKFAGEPAYTVPNPHNVTGPPSRLWKLSEIILVEESHEFQGWRAQNASRHVVAPLDILRERLVDGYAAEVLSDSEIEAAAFGADHVDSCMICDHARITETREGYLASYALRHLLTESNEVAPAIRDVIRHSAMDSDKANRLVSSQKFKILSEAYPRLMSHFANELKVSFLLY